MQNRPDNKTASNRIQQLEEFKLKEKFNPDNSLFYPGLADPTLKVPLTKFINLAADDFIEATKSSSPSDQLYQSMIRKGLARFSYALDTEERERICSYYEELMDIVGLESSDGILNNFMYGFDPTDREE